MSPLRVLVVDEEPRIVRGLEIMLRGAGYVVEAAETWLDALARVIVTAPDAVVLDLLRADGQGAELCREVRRSSGLPILVLSAVGAEHDTVRALDAGADDFVRTPFDADELLARLRGVMRGQVEAEGSIRSEIGGLMIDGTASRVTRAGAQVALTPVEFALVRVLAQHHGRPVTDRQLLRALWGPECVHETRELRVLVARIRSRLERDPSRPEYLISEPGVGYRLRDPLTRSRQAALR